MLRYSIIGSLCVTSLCASDFCFVNKKDHWHFEADFSAMTDASFYRPEEVKNSSLQYAEGTSSIYFNHFVSENNALVYQLGMNYTHLGWKDNPRFSEENYYYGIASISLVSYAIERWRWVINGGMSFDASECDIGNSGVYYTLLWGRYQYAETFAMHVGFFGYYGAGGNGYMLPVLGCDWWWSKVWEFKAIFPLETSINYHINPQFATGIMFTTFGGPYRFPRRIQGGEGRWENGIFEIYSTGVEADLKYKSCSCIQAGIGAGYNFGGWIYIKDEHNHHKRYYQYNSSAYGRIYFNFTF